MKHSMVAKCESEQIVRESSVVVAGAAPEARPPSYQRSLNWHA